MVGTPVIWVSYHLRGGGPHVERVSGRGVILKWIQDWRIIQWRLPGDVRFVTSAASCSAIAIDHRCIEPFMEKPPGHSQGIQQITNILSRHVNQGAAGGGANVVDRRCVSNEGKATVPI